MSKSIISKQHVFHKVQLGKSKGHSESLESHVPLLLMTFKVNKDNKEW